MDGKPKRFHTGSLGAAITVRVNPRASRNEIAGIMEDGTIKIRLTAPPVEGKANEALIAFLSEVLDVPRGKIEIVAGMTGRNKLVSIIGLDPASVQERITERIEKK